MSSYDQYIFGARLVHTRAFIDFAPPRSFFYFFRAAINSHHHPFLIHTISWDRKLPLDPSRFFGKEAGASSAVENNCF